jgi:peptide/nickel transport system permease protein
VSLAQLDHVFAARALGCGSYRILFCDLIPLALAPLIVEATFDLAAAVIAEAGPSLLGLGVQPPDASWATGCAMGCPSCWLRRIWCWPPGVALLLVVLAVNRFGDVLCDRLDVRFM